MGVRSGFKSAKALPVHRDVAFPFSFCCFIKTTFWWVFFRCIFLYLELFSDLARDIQWNRRDANVCNKIQYSIPTTTPTPTPTSTATPTSNLHLHITPTSTPSHTDHTPTPISTLTPTPTYPHWQLHHNIHLTSPTPTPTHTPSVRLVQSWIEGSWQVSLKLICCILTMIHNTHTH